MQTKLIATLEIPENIPITKVDRLVLEHVKTLACVLGRDSYISEVLAEAADQGENKRLQTALGIKMAALKNEQEKFLQLTAKLDRIRSILNTD